MIEKVVESTNSPLLNPDAFNRYLTRDAREIILILKRLAERRALLSAYVNDGPPSFVTAVLALTDDQSALILDASIDEHMNERSVTAESLTCLAQLDGVRIQFSVSAIVRFPHDGLSALRAPIPETLLRLQRRDSYRLSVPMTNPVGCQITFIGDDKQCRTVAVRVLDISTNGISFAALANEIPLAPAMEIEDCLISLPEGGAAKVKLKVRNLHHATTPSGMLSIRAGCQFIEMPGKFATQIQRYIFTVERDRRQLETGGGG